ncbi:hypothetical protein K1T35_12675 [Pseudonocardia sp. DSM 110487]|uniref:hypothetical protein n=1 Tax=Pseudonocardia sp. DSM 110487 TaxID=2865833 RepID=UPI001C69D9A0|nr:hypothetical protein [Pseudonocardia sp. DSM 110487]QYN38011.1 hypothetical protein K1T35_12675 [Pseudonocardia sp. DSM 110487]
MAVARHASRRARPGRAEIGSRLPLVIGAIVTFVAAITFDVLAGEHPTHTVALALVALAVAALRLQLGGRREGLVSVVSGAVVAQPVLHATAKLDTGVTHHASGGLLHMLLTDGPGTAMQLAVSAAIVIAVATSGRIAQLLLTALRRPVRLLLVSGPPPPAHVRTPARRSGRRHGSMLRWCGWSIQAARRGPPNLALA